jgi:hypothetical protein
MIHKQPANHRPISAEANTHDERQIRGKVPVEILEKGPRITLTSKVEGQVRWR